MEDKEVIMIEEEHEKDLVQARVMINLIRSKYGDMPEFIDLSKQIGKCQSLANTIRRIGTKKEVE